MYRKTCKGLLAVAIISIPLFHSSPSYANPAPTTPIVTEIEIEDLESTIQRLDNKIIESMEKVKELNSNIEDSKSNISRLESEIKESEEKLKAYQEIIANRLRSIQLHGNTPLMTYVDAIFSAKGLTEMINRITTISTIMENDQEIMKNMKEQEQKLKVSKKKLEEELSSLEKDKKVLSKEQASIEQDKKNVEEKLEKAKEELRKERERLERERQEEERRERERQEALQRQLQHHTSIATPSTPSVDLTTLAYSSDKAQKVISYGKNFLGVPYVWGGTTPSGFDCSGFVQYVYHSIGVNLPRVSKDQQNYGVRISPNQVQPGDLVFKGSPAYHVGIYIGDGKWLHAPRTGDVVKIANYNPSSFTSASRVF